MLAQFSQERVQMRQQIGLCKNFLKEQVGESEVHGVELQEVSQDVRSIFKGSSTDQKASNTISRLAQVSSGLEKTSAKVLNGTTSAVSIMERMEKVYGDQLEDLLKFKSKVHFYSAFRDHILTLMYQLFNALPASVRASYPGFHKDFLPALQDEAMNQDQDATAPTPATSAWLAVIKAKGLTKEEWDCIREVKDAGNSMFHDKVTVSDGITLLKSKAPLPEGSESSRKPLLKVLEILQQSGAKK